MIKTEDTDKILLPKGAIAKEIKIWMSRKDLRQKWLAATLGITVPSVSDKLKGVTPFTTDELMTIAGALGLSLSELLGEDIVNAKLPAPTYTEEKGKKKVAPIGFIPKGATYDIIPGDEASRLVGSVGLEPTTKGLSDPAYPGHNPHHSPTPGLLFCPATLNTSHHISHIRSPPCFGNHINLPSLPGNSHPGKPNLRPLPANAGSNTSHAPTHPRQP